MSSSTRSGPAAHPIPVPVAVTGQTSRDLWHLRLSSTPHGLIALIFMLGIGRCSSF